MDLKYTERKLAKFKILESLSILLFLWTIYQLFTYRNVFSGDPEIHLIYAKNFVNGHFLEFNPGFKTGGESSFLYFLIVSFMYKLFGNNAAYGMKLISLLSFFWIIFQIYLVNSSEDKSIKLIGAGLLSVIGMMNLQALLGMENIFFSAILITFISSEVKSNLKCKNTNIIGKSIFLFLLRPEGLIYPFFLSVKALYIKEKKLLIFAILSFISCGFAYFIISIISGGDFYNAGSIRRYISMLPINTINNYNFNLFGYQLSIYFQIFRKLIYAYPIIFGIFIFRKHLRKSDILISIIFVLIPLFLYFFNFLPTIHFSRYFIYGYSTIFLLFSSRVIPNLSKILVLSIGICYLSFSIYVGIKHNHQFLTCSKDNNVGCSIYSDFREYVNSISDKNVKKNSDKIFNDLSKSENEIIDIATVEVQIRNRLDKRFRVWSLDGIVDREIKQFKNKSSIDHFKYIDFRNINYLADLPNLNLDKSYPSLNDFASSLNKNKTPEYCTIPSNVNNVKTENCFLKTEKNLESKCIKNKKLIKTNVRSENLNLGGWNGGWLWEVKTCEN